MKYTKVLHDAWNFASENKKMVWFAFLPSFVTVLIFVAESSWQGFFMFEEFGKIEHGTVFNKIGSFIDFISIHHLWIWFIFLLFVIFLFSFVFPAWIQSTIILSIRQKFTAPEKKLSLRQKTIEGSNYFFKMFEFHAIISPFSFLTIIFYFLAFYRYTHGDTSHFFFTILIILAIIAVFVNLFFAYAPFFIVCEKESVSTSLKKSIGLVFLNFGKTVGLILLMLLVNLRVIINVLVVFGVPIGIIYLTSLFTKSDWLFTVSVIGGIIGGIVMLGLAAYLTAILEVFSLGFWERAFTTLRQEQKKLEFDNDEPVPEEIETITAEIINHENPAKKETSPITQPKPVQITQEIQPPHPNKPESVEGDTAIHFKVE
jgi:hypothetical protein